ncbi:hypothetical protein [Nocardiopsis ansamitocini]|uniref:Uncharacterized protein n=1 Tax=Nocardiopsis ansamitocini TaxID=1670832 RepID=A0A9W6UJ40_9ACTN|nr:hypothetical protein [Nocardiopsis ansamitocini]GLU48424.1 hypothetical protein Nans01_27750 [Nocardiopsis ansamitocini]
MIADMETINPNPDPREAAAGLDAAAGARRAVRDRPWPVWLYPINAILLGGLALAGLLHSSMLATFVVLIIGIALAALNYWAGRLMGAPFVIPTSTGFRILGAVSGAFVIGSLFARAAGLEWVIVVCAIGAVASYGLGSILHYRSTHR